MESHWLGCRIGKHEYCFDMAEVRGIEGHESMRNGAIRIGAADAPVRPLAELLGLESSGKTNGPVLILSDGVVSFGVQADSVFRGEGQQQESSQALALPPAIGRQSAICYGVTRMNGRIVPCIDAGRIHPDSARRWHTHRDVVHAAAQSQFERIASGDAAAKRLLCFETGRNEAAAKTVCGVSYSQLLEVSQDLRPVSIPGLGEHSTVLGIADWRDRIIPVIDVRKFLDLRFASAGEEGLFAILRGVRTADVFAVPMREVRTVTLPLSNASLRESQADLAMPLRGSFVYQGGKLLIPDFDAFF